MVAALDSAGMAAIPSFLLMADRILDVDSHNVIVPYFQLTGWVSDAANQASLLGLLIG